jgi:apolipoprotein D and lipocalin family protein
MGKWYEIQKYPLTWDVGQKCITANYTLNDNGTVTVFNSGVTIL